MFIALCGIAGCAYYQPEHTLPFDDGKQNDSNVGDEEYPNLKQNENKIELSSPEIEGFKSELKTINIVDGVSISQLTENGVSKQIDIEITISPSYSNTDITDIFYKICASISSSPSGLSSIARNDKGEYTNILLTIISSDEVQYQMINTINQELAGRRGLVEPYPEWYSIIAPEREQPFSFLYTDTPFDKNQLTSEMITKIGDADVFNMDDIAVMNDILGFSVGDTLNYIYTIHQPEQISALFQSIWMQCSLHGYYDYGYVRYNPDSYYVTWLTIDSPQYKGPRDTVVGDNYQDVIDKFPIVDIDEYDETRRMRTLYGSPDNAPSGAIFYDEKGNIDYLKYIALGERIYYLGYSIKNDVVKEISIGIMYDD